ncbi:methyl-accepting chemotaxis protein [Psychrobium sp. 1_MG-2023]|uniref:methyl-accepting chemotaxis protein n=1 Tax=Psychrobium sp. 1_MG-2023 TaxID=3062624 RepID=UPI0026A5AAC3|nr:methyl-accepting chemotaxis protein [Psychrobium sp. 1_MG-2023]MDP2560088.1 methyl-accepting chemotaxis protein [Psychrobium sp. 1_MG-2023]
MNKLTIAQRIWSLTIVAVCIILAKLAFGLVDVKHQLTEDYKHRLSSVIDVAHSIVATQHRLVTEGKLSTEQAQKNALKTIQGMRFQGNEYFWVNDMQPVMLMHPIKPSLNQKHLGKLEDPNGKQIFNEFVKTVQQSGQGYVDYYWPRAGSDTPVPKISYVKGFQPWGWIVGSGIYVDDIEETYAAERNRQVVVIIVAIIVLLAASIFIGRSIIIPLQQAKDAMDDIAQGEGDLTVKLQVNGEDELAELSRSFNTFVEKIRVVISKVNDFGGELSHSSAGLTGVAANSRSQIDHSQNEVDQVATAITELSSTVNEVAGNADNASQIVQQVNDQASSGQAEVTRSINSMLEVANVIEQASDSVNELESNAQNIGNIVVVIKSIAEQTNLLALNAAIEAARAGDQGRGFAVVADEVRVLAQRTQESTTEIEQMIESLQSGSQSFVNVIDNGKSLAERGVEQSQKSGEAFEHIAEQIQQIVDMNAQVAAATQEQRVVVDGLSNNVNSIHEAFGASLNDSISIASSSQQLDALANELSELLAQFKT